MATGQPKKKTNDNDPIGAMIRQLREGAGMTQAELAFQVGVDARSVQRWETPDKGPGKGTLPGAAELLKILSVFGIEVPGAPRYGSLAVELERIHARLDELVIQGAQATPAELPDDSEIEHPVLQVLAEIINELRQPDPPSPARLAEMRRVVDEFAEANRTGFRLVATLQARLKAADSAR